MSLTRYYRQTIDDLKEGGMQSGDSVYCEETDTIYIALPTRRDENDVIIPYGARTNILTTAEDTSFVSSVQNITWATATNYLIGQEIVKSGVRYMCRDEHTSNMWLNDYLDDVWLPISEDVGSIKQVLYSEQPWIDSNDPDKWAILSGLAINRVNNPILFQKFGTNYGQGDGSTTFNLPNFSALFTRMVGTQTVNSISYTAQSLGASTGDTFQSHLHKLNTNANVLSAGTALLGGLGILGLQVAPTTNPPIVDGGNGTPRTGSETKPVSIGVNYVIKLG